MLFDDLRTKFEKMSPEELEDYFSSLRSRTREKSTGKVKTTGKPKVNQLEKLLASLTPEQRQQVLAQFSKKG